eukprot:1999988-Prymnesium_polylepis.1
MRLTESASRRSVLVLATIAAPPLLHPVLAASALRGQQPLHSDAAARGSQEPGARRCAARQAFVV